MERARNRRRRQREHIRLELELLESLLVLHAKAMLFVDDDETETLERHIGTQQSMRTDHDVEGAFGELREYCHLFLRRLKAAEHRDTHREIGEPLTEGSSMLVGENGRRYEHGHLPFRLHRLERSANGDLGFSIADVADE